MTPPAQPEIAAASTLEPTGQLASLLQTAAFSRLNQVGWVRVKGEDRVRWLNGMVTNSIQQLQTGQGSYNYFLNAQGRIQGDATVFAQSDSLLIETASSQIPALLTFLDRFIIMDDVELTDITQSQSGLFVAGPQAASLLAKINLNGEALEPLRFQITSWNTANITVIHAYSPLVPRFELWASPEDIEKLAESLQNAGAAPCEPKSLDWLRILEGTPIYGIDIRDRELPQETGQTRALHFNKGCYLGQEIVERIRSRGNVHRTFTAFQLEGEMPVSGAVLEADGKQVGELTSVASIPGPTTHRKPLQLGLGYIRREVLDRGTPVHYPGGIATPVSLPFSGAASSALSAASESPERV